MRILSLGRDLADAVLVGAGTAAAERYAGLKRTPRRVQRRTRLGLSEVPRVAVVSGSCSIGPDSPLLTDTVAPPVVVTTGRSDPAARDELRAAGADVVLAGDDELDVRAALAGLDRLGLRRIDCEGGPSLFASLVAADAVDQLCLTVSPVLAGAGAGRIAEGAASDAARGMALASVLHEDGYVMLRYTRERPAS